MTKENITRDSYKWSIAFKVLSSTMAAIVLLGSYFMSVLAEGAKDAGNINEATLMGLMSLITLPAALLIVVMVAWKLLFNVPTEKAPNWLKTKN